MSKSSSCFVIVLKLSGHTFPYLYLHYILDNLNINLGFTSDATQAITFSTIEEAENFWQSCQNIIIYKPKKDDILSILKVSKEEVKDLFFDF